VKPAEQRKFLPVLNALKRDLIENARRAVRGGVHIDRNDAPDELDNASSESGLAFIGRLRDRERTLLEKIDGAISKIEVGSYGTCESCGEDIEPSRLMARPVAELCIECKQEQERLER
jgi:DnaK suppressor protein